MGEEVITDYSESLTRSGYSDNWGNVPMLDQLTQLNPFQPPDAEWRKQLGPVLYIKSEDVWGWMSVEVPPGCQYSWLDLKLSRVSSDQHDKMLRITFADGVTMVWRSRVVQWFDSDADYDFRSNIYRFAWPD